MKSLCSLVAIIATVQVSQAFTLNNGSLTVNIRNDNGAIDDVLFGGTDYFNPGTPVSNWGFQTGTNTSTFVVNDTSGATGQSVSVSSGVVTGTYTASGANLAFTRTYQLVTGTNTLRIDMSYENLGPTITFRQFETFDPDQGAPLVGDYQTYNDVFNLGGTQVAQASISSGGYNDAVVLGSPGSPYSIASGNPFSISSGSVLNSFFSSPFDGNGALSDSGMHIGFERSLATGETTSYSIYLAVGGTPSDAQTSYLSAIGAVPETSSILLSAIAALGVMSRRSRN